MYQIDHTKTVLQNLVGLFNLAGQNARHPIQEADILSVGIPTVLVPGVGNGNSNSQVVVTGVDPGTHPGVGTVQYNRVSLAANRPTIGNRIFVVPEDTNATIHAKILAAQQIIASEVTFTDPPALPVGTQTVNYVLTVIANSKIYTPGTLTVGAYNPLPLTTPLPMAAMFHASTGQRNLTDVYLSATSITYVLNDTKDQTKTSVQQFYAYLNSLKDAILPFAASLPFTPANCSISAVEVPVATAINTFILITPIPGQGCPAAAPFYLQYNRSDFLGVAIYRGMGSTPSGLSILNAPDFPSTLAAVKTVYKVPADFLIAPTNAGAVIGTSKAFTGPAAAYDQTSPMILVTNATHLVQFLYGP